MAVSEVCAVCEVLCSVSNGHYTESDNCSIFSEEKGRRALGTRILVKGDTPMKRASHILLKGDSHLIVDVYD
jgi:hypothetical protein